MRERRRYTKPCRSCGAFDVVIDLCAGPPTEPGEPMKEIVIGTCTMCEVIRCRYTRRVDRPAASA